ncbi:MAG: hypothetical protein Kow0069_36560 [Promethearchaeota archaeon]
MVFFDVKMNWDCSLAKESCSRYPDCAACLKDKLELAGLIVEGLAVAERSQETQVASVRSSVWREFQNILLLKAVVIIEAQSGACIVSVPVTEQVDGDLLSGFLQANVLFSTQGVSKGNAVVDEAQTFYEFSYGHFNILMLTGNFVRVCLILGGAASENLKASLAAFVNEFERQYANELFQFRQKGNVGALVDAEQVVRRVFKTYLADSFVVNEESSALPRKLPQLDADVLEQARQLSKENRRFKLTELLDAVTSGDSGRRDAFWVAYKFVKMGVFQSVEETRAATGGRGSPSTEPTLTLDPAEVLRVKSAAKELTEREARERVQNHLRNAAFLVKTRSFDKARRELEKALVVARAFNLHQLIGQVSFQILQLDGD